MQDKTFKFELTHKDCNVILEALSRLPLGQSYDTFNSMQAQLQGQQAQQQMHGIEAEKKSPGRND